MFHEAALTPALATFDLGAVAVFESWIRAAIVALIDTLSGAQWSALFASFAGGLAGAILGVLLWGVRAERVEAEEKEARDGRERRHDGSA